MSNYRFNYFWGTETMLTFWAVLTAENIESYVRGLMLPDYLSHLTMDPFSFSRQGHNADGRLPLKLTYRGPGRLEEFLLDPVPNALGLLAKWDIKLNPDQITLPESEAVWNWTVSENGDTPDSNEGHLRIFFAPKGAPSSIPSQKYDTGSAYVSASRREIFLAPGVLTDFMTAYCRSLLAADSPLKHQEADVQVISGSGTFQFGPIQGRFIPDYTILARFLIDFAGLDKPLEQITPYFDHPVYPGHFIFDETGIRIPLLEKK